MCGIAGFINFPNGVELAERANEIQKHRGPDSQNVWSDGRVAFAHQRLSIIDLSDNANQPLVKGQYIITYNGEVYNYNELKSKYLTDVNFISNSDTEVVLELFIKFGVDSFRMLEGMFSFAIYDSLSGTTYIVRDFFGIKPLFYLGQTDRFSFSSELKTIVKLVPFDKKINKVALIGSLNYLWVPGPETMFLGVFKLEPGSFLMVNANGNYIKYKYWDLKESNKIIIDENTALIELTQRIENSISRHMVADVEIGSFLSGGLDSSLISVLAKNFTKKLCTYTIGINDKDKKIEKMPSDQNYAKKIAELHGFDHTEILLNSDITNLLPSMVKYLDEPIGDPAALNTFLICSEARKQGIRVLLSGMGADEILFGYRRQKALLISLQYKKLPKIIRNIITIIVDILPVKIGPYGLKFSRWSKKFISFAEKPIEEAYLSSYSYYSENELKELLKDDISQEIKVIYKNHRDIFYSKYNNDLINQMCNTDINMFMVGLNLTYTDRASMAASVEVRVPFIDKDVIETSMKISGTLKFKNKESKSILKKIAKKYLPDEIIYRSKASFGAPIRSWISNELKNLVDDCLSKRVVEQRGIFNYEIVKKLIDCDRNNSQDNAYRIYQLITLELWMREYVDID